MEAQRSRSRSPRTPTAPKDLSTNILRAIDQRKILTATSRKRLIADFVEDGQLPDSPRSPHANISRRTLLRNNAEAEILKSEYVYINQLETIKTYFMEPIQQRQLLSADNFERVFGQINSIYAVHHALLKELCKDLMVVTTAFAIMAPYFKLYSVYAGGYKDALDIIEGAKANSKKFREFISSQETRPEVQSSLSALLISPIQRITRYCLLIRQVMDLSRPFEIPALKETCQLLDTAVNHVNKHVADSENARQMLKLAGRIKDGKSLVIKPGRRLYKEGAMKLFNIQKDAKDDVVHLALFDDILMTCKKRRLHLCQAALECVSIWPLSKCAVRQNAAMMISITCDGNKMVVYDDNKAEETTAWLQAFRDAHRGYYEARSSLQTEGSTRRPAMRANLESYRDHGVSPGQRRVRRRRSTMLESTSDDAPPLVPAPTPRKKAKMATSCLPRPLFSRRRRLNDSDGDKVAENKENDSLFPLREHFLSNEATAITVPLQTTDNTVSLYVFGRANEQRRFNFSLSSIFKSVKETFGFKK